MVSSTCVIVPKKRKPRYRVVLEATRRSVDAEFAQTLQPDDGSLFRDFPDVRAVPAGSSHGGHDGLARMEGADTPSLRTLHYKEHA